MPAFFAVVHKDPDSDYGVSFPDLPGCISAGATLDEARAMASEALAMHLEALRDDGEPLPIPSSLESVASSVDAGDAMAIILVEVQSTALEAMAT